jgi:hypothetical protein
MSSHFSIGVACLALAALGLPLRILYNLCFYPLSRVPGPRLAAATSLWLFLSDFRGHAYADILALHRKYGPVVRISPDEVSIRDIDLYHKTIYSQNTKFRKAPYYYYAFHNPGSTVFSETAKDAHASEKRLMSYTFSRGNLLGL